MPERFRMIHIPVEGDITEVEAEPRFFLKDMIEQIKTLPLVNSFGETYEGGMMWPRVVMLVDEEGLLKNLPHNPRANLFYPGGLIVGDALFVGSLWDDEDMGFDWNWLPDDITVDWVKAEMSRLSLLRTGRPM